jgi:Glycosyl hydrolases family 2, TIM barrel domain
MRRFLYGCILILLAQIAISPSLFAEPSRVTIVKDKGEWKLLVSHKRFFIKGIGCQQAFGEKGEDYLHMAHEMGANAVRTWGGASRSYLDHAQENDLMVDLGIWLNPIRETGSKESYQNADYRKTLRQQIRQYVHDMKDHPALLMWNLGNETFAYTDDPKEKAALGHFLQEMVRDVHAEDPNHPVIYSCSADRDLPDVEKYVPALDAIGTNVYGSLSPVLGWMRNNGKEKPVVVTEFGPLGSWDCPKDKNGLAFDPMDNVKSDDYASIWRQIVDAQAKCLGGFAFVLGEPRNQDSLTWYNVNQGELKRASFWTLYKAYTQMPPPNRPPEYSEMRVDVSTAVAPGQRIEVWAMATDPEKDKIDYDYFVTAITADPLIVEPPKFYPVAVEKLGPGHARLSVPNDPGLYRVYVQASDTHQNAAIIDRSIRVGN